MNRIVPEKLHVKTKSKLFWVSTRDHGEDWFIIAKNAKLASRYHEGFEGYDIGESKAKKVCDIEKAYEKRKAYHAQIWMLRDIGFEILSEEPSRIVRKNNKIYKEGTTLNAVLLESSDKSEGMYIINIAGSNQYKIGITKNLRKRLKTLQTGSPFIIELFGFYPIPNPRNIERELHKICKNRWLSGEWFELTFDDVKQIDNYLSSFNRYF